EGARGYQLYWPTDDELAVSFLRRARAAGYTHLVITLDTTLLGWRPLDLDRGYSPFFREPRHRELYQRPGVPTPPESTSRRRPARRRHRLCVVVPEPWPELEAVAADSRELGRADPAEGDPGCGGREARGGARHRRPRGLPSRGAPGGP